jgi:peptide/nickel transport system permease protein
MSYPGSDPLATPSEGGVAELDRELDEEQPHPGDAKGRRNRRKSRARRRQSSKMLGVVGIVLIGIPMFASLIGPFLVGHDPNSVHVNARLQPPGAAHWLGTDSLGRDVLARALYGGRVTLAVVVLGLVLGLLIGASLGIVAGFFGGKVDGVISRFVDAQLALPPLIMALVLSAVLGAGFFTLAITLGISMWAVYARIIRADVIRIRNEEYITAAIALGGSRARLLVRHVLPNVVSTLLVVASLELGHLILVESSLSYLGFGIEAPNSSWGSMIKQGQPFIETAWWLCVTPGVLISMTILGLNFVGDWLRDVFDPYNVER